MANNKMLIDASHPEETRVVVLHGNRIEEYDFESQNKRQLKGNIYLAKVTRVEPSLQAAFVDYGGNRHGFLAFNEIHPDYYQIPIADRQALLAEEAADARQDNNAEDEDELTSDAAAENDKEIQAKEILEDEGDTGSEPEEKAKPKPKRRQPRPRRKTAAKKPADDSNENGDSGPSQASAQADDTGASSDADDDDSTSMAAMMETDSIWEPAPDDNSTDEEDENSLATDDDTDVEAKEKKPVKKRPRSTRRPRKTAKTNAPADESEPASEEADTAKSSDAPQDAPVGESTEETDSNSEDNGDAEITTKEKKPKSRRARKPSRSRSRKSSKDEDDENSNDDDTRVDTSGQEDAMEEVPPRRRSRRQYKIQEVIKRRQVLLVQVVKEERGNKGAALTTYLSLAGRYSVLMPNTARGGGISRKITNSADRKRLKTIASGLEVPEGMGVILRTAGASRDTAEIQRDFEYLMRLWENVRELTLSSSAPCLVYEEGSLIKRSIRDLYDKNTSEILVAGEAGHKEARDFMEMLMPSHTEKVKLYREEQAMFSRFGIETQLDKMLSQQVTLKSGGYLVIDQTEALVAIDVNSGRATREHSIEETALQTNLETAEEVARQLRLRDLAGLIVIDFIDMEENRNNRAVEKKLKECLKHDRARIQVGRISHFGLMEMSRQRMRASVLDSTMDVCPHCQGKGHVRSNSSVSLHILRAIDEHLLKNSRFDIQVKASHEIALQILNLKRQALMEIEQRFGLKIFIEGNGDLLGENFTIEKGEPSTGERKAVNHVKVGQSSDMPAIAPADDNSSNAEDGDAPKRKRRRRRSRANSDDNDSSSTNDETTSNSDTHGETERPTQETDEAEPAAKRKRTRGKRGGRNSRKESGEDTTPNSSSDDASMPNQLTEPASKDGAPSVVEAEPATRGRNSRPRKTKPKADKVAPEKLEDSSQQQVDDIQTATSEATPEIAEASEPPRGKRRPTKRRQIDAASNDEGTPTDDVADKTSDQEEQGEDAQKDKKRGGWWSRSGFFG